MAIFTDFRVRAEGEGPCGTCGKTSFLVGQVPGRGAAGVTGNAFGIRGA